MELAKESAKHAENCSPGNDIEPRSTKSSPASLGCPFVWWWCLAGFNKIMHNGHIFWDFLRIWDPFRSLEKPKHVVGHSQRARVPQMAGIWTASSACGGVDGWASVGCCPAMVAAPRMGICNGMYVVPAKLILFISLGIQGIDPQRKANFSYRNYVMF